MFGTAIGWVHGLSIGSKVALGAATVVTGSAIATSPPPATTHTVNVKEASVVHTVEPVTEIKTELDKQKVAYSKKTIDSDSYDQGIVLVTTEGADGERTLTYDATYVDGVLKDRKLVKQEVTKQPVNEITTRGTRVVYVAPEPEPAAPSNCDSNYSGACVPIASDVDCGSGSGNGPAYLYGTATVVGSDVYGLDRDGDGIACE